MRQIVLDTETTGLEPALGHRVIEIGAVELLDRKLTGQSFHKYIHPERDIDEGAMEVHGITLDFLAGKPKFSEIADEFLGFVCGAELVIHNAPFDVGFLNLELSLLSDFPQRLEEVCDIVDTLALARRKHPGQKNNLDALCRRYHIDNSQRTLHGALLDAEILADVYLAMTGGQRGLFTSSTQHSELDAESEKQSKLTAEQVPALTVVLASEDEISLHERYLDMLQSEAENGAVWDNFKTADSSLPENP